MARRAAHDDSDGVHLGWPVRMRDGLLLLSLLVLLTAGTSGSMRSRSRDGGPPPPLSPPPPPVLPAPGAATAVVTLVNEPGEEAGAIALGASLAMAGSVARRVVLVRGGLGAAIRSSLLRAFWDEVEETEGVRCRTAPPPHAREDGDHDHDHDCTVLAVFSLTRFDRLLFLDASTLALPPLDVDALLSHKGRGARVMMAAPTAATAAAASTASTAYAATDAAADEAAAAAPALLVLTPSLDTLRDLLALTGDDREVEEGDGPANLLLRWCRRGRGRCASLPDGLIVDAARFGSSSSTATTTAAVPTAVLHFGGAAPLDRPWQMAAVFQSDPLPAWLDLAVLRRVQQSEAALLEWVRAHELGRLWQSDATLTVQPTGGGGGGGGSSGGDGEAGGESCAQGAAPPTQTLAVIVNVHTTTYWRLQMSGLALHAAPHYATHVFVSPSVAGLRLSLPPHAAALRVHVHPAVIAKRRGSGTLFRGIMAALALARTTLGDALDLVLVCSARTVLARPLAPPVWITAPVAAPNGSQVHVTDWKMGGAPWLWKDTLPTRLRSVAPTAVAGLHEGLLFRAEVLICAAENHLDLPLTNLLIY